MHDIINPSIPFDLPVKGFPQNAEVFVFGRSMKGRDGVFVVEFAAGQNTTVLHLSFRYKKENVLVINTLTNGTWQHEERHQNPISHEQSFVLQIQNISGAFLLRQKQHTFEFKHRMDPMSITSMRINGDVSVEKIKFERFDQGPQAPYANAPHPTVYPQGPYPSGPQGLYSNASSRPSGPQGPYQSGPQGQYSNASSHPSGPQGPYQSGPQGPYSNASSHPSGPQGPQGPYSNASSRPSGPQGPYQSGPQGPYSNASSHPSGQYPTNSHVYGDPRSSYIGYQTPMNPDIGGGIGFDTPKIGSGATPNTQFGSGIGFGTHPSPPSNPNYPRPR